MILSITQKQRRMQIISYLLRQKEGKLRKYNNFNLHFRFELKNEKINFLNAEYVHPLKQQLVQELQRDFEEDNNIKAVIVFGSGVEFRCNSCSDLDLCIERYDHEKYFRCQTAGLEEAVDVLYADRIGERMRCEIEEKGIVVYDREDCYV